MSSSDSQHQEAPTEDALLEVNHLRVVFTAHKSQVCAVDDLDLKIMPKEIVGLVGESGCGKSSTARCLAGLTPCQEGSIRFAGRDYAGASARQWRSLRRDLQMVFQDPYASLNPRMCARDIIAEPLRNYGLGNRKWQRQRVRELLAMVGLDADSEARFPHEFSGGQRQRIGIARALALEPRLLICDEPVSALDVSVQAQIINLLLELRQRLGIAMLIIAHDLAVIRHLADRVAVMYLGRIVEEGRDLFHAPAHPYTRALWQAIPHPSPAQAPQQALIAGDPPSPEQRPQGCAFAPRCPRATPRCQQAPQLTPIAPHHRVACWHPEDGV